MCLVVQEEEAQLLAEQHRSAYLASGFHQHHHHHHHAAVGPAPLPTPSIILQDPLLHAAPPDIYVRTPRLGLFVCVCGWVGGGGGGCDVMCLLCCGWVVCVGM